MGILRRTVLHRLKSACPEQEVGNTCGSLAKHTRMTLGIARSHCADAFCLAGHLEAKRLWTSCFQKQTRRYNRQIHKRTILKKGIRKRNQAPCEIHGVRLFGKALCKGETGDFFGRRAS